MAAMSYGHTTIRIPKSTEMVERVIGCTVWRGSWKLDQVSRFPASASHVARNLVSAEPCEQVASPQGIPRIKVHLVSDKASN